MIGLVGVRFISRWLRRLVSHNTVLYSVSWVGATDVLRLTLTGLDEQNSLGLLSSGAVPF